MVQVLEWEGHRRRVAPFGRILFRVLVPGGPRPGEIPAALRVEPLRGLAGPQRKRPPYGGAAPPSRVTTRSPVVHGEVQLSRTGNR